MSDQINNRFEEWLAAGDRMLEEPAGLDTYLKIRKWLARGSLILSQADPELKGYIAQRINEARQEEDGGGPALRLVTAGPENAAAFARGISDKIRAGLAIGGSYE